MKPMFINNHPSETDQRGVVAILSVLLFTVLMAVVTVSFTKIMLSEQQQTLEDSLSKSAYNAAQAGVEEAKRAIAYCNTQSGALRTACETQLFTPQCPGFNTDPGSGNMFQTFLGIPAVSASSPTGSAIGDPATAQGYSCVIVRKNTNNIVKKLTPDSELSSAMFELKTTSPFSEIVISWHNNSTDGLATVPSHLPTRPFQVNGNPRATAWDSDSSGAQNAPAVLRLTSITLPPGSFMLSEASMKTYFVYPSTQGSVFRLDDEFSIKTSHPAARQRAEAPCLSLGYLCSISLRYYNVPFGSPLTQSGNRFLLVQTLYRPTTVSITARLADTAAEIPFDGAQYSIDSTGFAGPVYRRIETRVRLGDDAALSGATLDLGEKLCKSFSVGRRGDVFDNSECAERN